MPEIQVHELTPNDKYLLMATDGLWDALSRKTAAALANSLLQQKAHKLSDKEFKDALTQKLLETALTQAAKNSRMTLQDLNRLGPGNFRRSIVDDISLFVVDLSSQAN